MLKYLSYQPYRAEMIRFVPHFDLPSYFSILRPQLSPGKNLKVRTRRARMEETDIISGDFVSGLADEQVSKVVWQMHPNTPQDGILFRIFFIHF